jgi:hypothetical protein
MWSPKTFDTWQTEATVAGGDFTFFDPILASTRDNKDTPTKKERAKDKEYI